MQGRSSFSLTIFLSCVNALALLSLFSAVRADIPESTDICVGYDGLLVDKAKLNNSIQVKLGEIYKQSDCYRQYSESQRNPLNDQVVGSVTKKWINQALTDHKIECPEVPACDAPVEPKTLDSADSGLQPYVLLQKDLDTLTINRAATEILDQFIIDQEKNDFVTAQQVLDGAVKALSGIENITQDILDAYRKDLTHLVGVREVSSLGEDLVDKLIAADLIEEANALKPLLGSVQPPERLTLDAKNSLTELLAEKKKDILKEAESIAKDEAEKLEIKAKKEEEKVSAELKAKLTELATIDTDAKTLLGIFKKWGEKIVDVAKIGPRTVDTVVEDVSMPAEEEFEKIMENILGREIAKVQKSKLKFEQEGKVVEAASEAKKLNDLQKLYADEKQRLENNVEIKKQNFALEEKKKALEAKKQEAKLNVPKATDLIKVDETMAIVAEATVTSERYYIAKKDFSKIWPALDPSVSACAVNLLNYVYPSREAMGSSIHSMLASLDEVAANKANPGSEMTTDGFTCELVGEIPKVPFKALSDREGLLNIARKPFLVGGLSEINLDVLPGCTDCSLPMRGTNYGFYPFWKSSDMYQEIGLNTVNPGTLDLSVFTRMGYFALPIGDDGKITNLLHWNSSASVRSFVETLSKYNVKRDIVLYSKNWCHWGEQITGSDCKLFDSQDRNINAQNKALQYAEEHYEVLKSLNDKVKDVGGINGVTLYFDDYTSEVDASNIITYVKHLKKLMNVNKKTAAGEVYTEVDKPLQLEINLLLGIKDFDKEHVEVGEKVSSCEPNYFRKIRELFIPARVDDDMGSKSSQQDSRCALDHDVNESAEVSELPPVKQLLVFLNEDTSPYKKRLRTQIENEFSGGKRVDALLSVVPILSRAKLGEVGDSPYVQYLDDIAYLKYNLGGIGVWDLPLTGFDEEGKLLPENEQMTLFSNILKHHFDDPEKNYVDYAKLGFVGEWLYSPVLTSRFSVCGHVCPHRKRYGGLFIFLIFANVLTEFFWRTNCTARVIIVKLGPAHNLLRLSVVLVFFALLGCDPAWQAHWDIILLIPIVSIVVLGIYFLFGSKYEKET